MSRFSDYIVYVDEYGDRHLDKKEPPYCIQSFCIFDKQHYSKVIVPQLQQLKFQHFGHDAFELTAEDFYQQQGFFKRFTGTNQRQQFNKDINALIKNSNFILIASIIDKNKIETDSETSEFDNALAFGLDHVYRFLQEREQNKSLIHIVFKRQGSEQDKALQSVFRNLCDQNTANKQTLPFELQWADKHSMPPALQLASFITQFVRTQQESLEQMQAGFEILKEKFYCRGGRKKVGEGYEGWGLKIFN